MKIFTTLAALCMLSLMLCASLAHAQSAHVPLPHDDFTGYSALIDDNTASLIAREQANAAQYVRNASDQITLTQFHPDGTVAVPYGDWLGSVLSAFALAIGTALSAFVVRFLNKQSDATAAARLREYTQSAVNYAINLVKDATKDAKLSVPVANEVIERALEYSIDLFGGLVHQFGGSAAQRLRIVSMLNVDGALAAPARIVAPTAPVEPPSPAP